MIRTTKNNLEDKMLQKLKFSKKEKQKSKQIFLQIDAEFTHLYKYIFIVLEVYRDPPHPWTL